MEPFDSPLLRPLAGRVPSPGGARALGVTPLAT